MILVKGCVNSTFQDEDGVGDQNEPLVSLVLLVLLVMFDSDEDDAPPDGPPFVRPMPGPMPRAMAFRIAASSRKSFHGLSRV